MSAGKVFDHSRLAVGLGEILWDMLPGGKRLGGAPANFAYHCHALGAEAKVLSAIGDDELGTEVIDQLNAKGIDVDHIGTNAHPTGAVEVSVSASGNACYTFTENAAWDHIELSERAEELARKCDAVCFGSLAQRGPVSRKSIEGFLSKTRADCLRVFDINLRQNYYSKDIIESSLRTANVFKLSDDELEVLRSLLDLSGSAEAALRQILERYELDLIALTAGAAGSTMLDADHLDHCQGISVEVKNTVGAGDSFTAMMVMGRLSGLRLDEINRLAGKTAAFVCTQDGAMPVLPAELIAELERACS
ncbi:MAG: carbohydrate kinase [Planctomycetes bacterium]|nr:carbohydrate kinase [Planctomycetota bacterium]